MRIVFILLALCHFSFASEAKGTLWQKKIIGYSQKDQSAFKPVKLIYKLSWNGAINSGKFTFELGKKDKRYPQAFISQAYGNSTGLAKILYPYKFSFTSFATSKTKTPTIFIGDEVDKKIKEYTKNSFSSSMVKHYKKTTLLKGNKSSSAKDYSFPNKGLHDPLTALFAMRSLPLKNGDEVHMGLFPSNKPYYAYIKVLGREKHNKVDCIKLSLELRKVDVKTMELKKYTKLKRPAIMWISDDLLRVPVELRSKVFIGDVRATLVSKSAL